MTQQILHWCAVLESFLASVQVLFGCWGKNER